MSEPAIGAEAWPDAIGYEPTYESRQPYVEDAHILERIDQAEAGRAEHAARLEQASRQAQLIAAPMERSIERAGSRERDIRDADIIADVGRLMRVMNRDWELAA